MRLSIFRILYLFLILFSATLQGQDISDVAGTWSGYITTDGRELPIDVTFSYADQILDGTIDIPDQQSFTLPVEVTDTSDDKLVFQFETGKGPAIFYGSRAGNGNQIAGEFNQSGKISPFILNRKLLSSAFFSDLPESDITIPVGDHEIGGTLLFTKERSPLVILVSGSGSQDRDQNIGGFRTYQKLASDLYDKGYSSFRYDDSGVGESTGKVDVTFPEMATDLELIIDYLENNYSDSISGIILLGHNQGGLVACMAADKQGVNGVILAATPFQPGEKIITDQIRTISEAKHIPDEIVEQNLQFQQEVYDVIRTGAGWQAIEDNLAERLEAQIAELPLEHQNALGDMSGFIQSQVDRQLETAKSRWFKSWIETDPVQVIENSDVPMLAVFGEKDTQILPESNKDVADSLAAKEDIALQTETIQDANHLFQQAITGMSSEYGMLDKEFISGFISEIDQFIESIQVHSPD